MNIGGIQFPTFNPYGKSTIEIYVSGCQGLCKACHNPELTDFKFGKELDIEWLIDYLKERENLFSIISITGGDLMCQEEVEAMNLVSTLKLCFPNKELWLFTGAELDQCSDWAWKLFDYIKTGLYNENEKQEGFPASKNQKLNKKGIDY